MTQNYLVFCINNNVKFVDGSIPSGKITANSINKNSIFTISPFAEDTIIKAVFQPKDRAIEPMTVWTVPTDKVKPQDLINPNKSYYELVKDWYVREVKIPSLVLEYISSARNTEIGITFFAQQRVVPQVPNTLTYDGYLDENTLSILNGMYKIVKPTELTWQGLALNFNDVVYAYNSQYNLIRAVQFADNTSTILYGVDPAILNDNFEYVDPTTTDLILEKIGELEADIRLLNVETIKTINGGETQTAFTGVTASGNTRTITTIVKIDTDPKNILEENIRGLLVDEDKIIDIAEEIVDSEETRHKIVDIVKEDINPYVNMYQLANKDITATRQDGQQLTLYFGFETIENELERLETAKLDKNFSNLANQTITNLSDELVINRGGVAYKTTLADLLSHVTITDLFVIVTVLPEVGQPNKIYLLAKSGGEEENIYEEYIWVDEEWELIGSVSIDLSNYYTKAQIDTLLGGKVDKVAGKGLSTNDYTTTEKNKLAGISAGAQVNVLEGVQVNGVDRPIVAKKVNIEIGEFPAPIDIVIQPSDFSSLVANKTVSGLGLGNPYIVVPSENFTTAALVRANGEEYANAELVIQNTANNVITFTASNLPTTDIKVTVYIMTSSLPVSPSFKSLIVGVTKTTHVVANPNGVYLVTVVGEANEGHQTKQYILSSQRNVITDVLSDSSTNNMKYTITFNGTSIAFTNFLNDGMTLINMYINELRV